MLTTSVARGWGADASQSCVALRLRGGLRQLRHAQANTFAISHLHPARNEFVQSSDAL